MPPVIPTNTLASLLQSMPKKAVGALVAMTSFAVIGALNTTSFALNKTADLIAWAANDRREESWMPLVTAICIFIYFFRLMLMKLFQNELENSVNGKLTPQQLQAMTETFAQTKKQATAEKAFSPNDEFSKNLRRDGARGNLFAQPESSSTPSNRASTRPPSPANSDDALLNEALVELDARPRLSKK